MKSTFFNFTILETFLYESNYNINPTNLLKKCIYPFFVFLKNKKESTFQQVGGLVAKNMSVYRESCSTSKARRS